MNYMRFLRRLTCSALFILMLNGCSWLQDWPPSDQKHASVAPPPATQQTRVVKSNEGTWLAPGSANTTMSAVDNIGKPNAMEAIPTNPVAAHSLQTHPTKDARIDALEKEITQLRNDLSMMLPAMTKLAESQSEMFKTLGNVEPAAGNRNIPNMNQRSSQAFDAPVGISPQNNQLQPKQKRARAQKAAAPAPQTYERTQQDLAVLGFVSQVRVGEHSDKTRIVLDLTDNASFDYEIDNTERLLIVSLPQTGWNATQRETLSKSKIVSSFQVEEEANGGSSLIVQLKSDAEIKWIDVLKPSSNKNHRLVIDLARI